MSPLDGKFALGTPMSVEMIRIQERVTADVFIEKYLIGSVVVATDTKKMRHGNWLIPRIELPIPISTPKNSHHNRPAQGSNSHRNTILDSKCKRTSDPTSLHSTPGNDTPMAVLRLDVGRFRLDALL
jgi:hypothetical protein